ncbi:MAG: hypothetical protein WC455_15900 [Dehalococcoidia bacterium]
MVTETKTDVQTKPDWMALKEQTRKFHRDLPEMAKDLLELGKDGFLAKWPVKCQQISHIKTSPVYKKLFASRGNTPPATLRKHNYPAQRKPVTPKPVEGKVLAVSGAEHDELMTLRGFKLGVECMLKR